MAYCALVKGGRSSWGERKTRRASGDQLAVSIEFKLATGAQPSSAPLFHPFYNTSTSCWLQASAHLSDISFVVLLYKNSSLSKVFVPFFFSSSFYFSFGIRYFFYRINQKSIIHYLIFDILRNYNSVVSATHAFHMDR